jgi:chromosome segregation ATPase
MNEIKNLNNFKSSVNDQGYIYCDLHSGDGKKILSRNRLKTEFDDNLSKIIKKINSAPMQNGTYLIRCYISPSSEGEIYCYHKGGVSSLGEGNGQKITIVQKEKDKPENNVLSYSSALGYQNEINKLTYEKALLEKEISELRAQLKDWEENYEEVDEEENPTLSEPKKDFMVMLKETLETFSATALPIIDRHYALKERTLEVELMKLGVKPKQKPVDRKIDPQAQAKAEAQKQILVDRIEGFLETVSEKDEDHYNELEQLSTETESLEEWLVKVKELYPGTYSEMENYLQNVA